MTYSKCLSVVRIFSDAKIYFITAKHQQGPQGFDHLKILCWKGHLNNIIKLEGEKGYEEQ